MISLTVNLDHIKCLCCRWQASGRSCTASAAPGARRPWLTSSRLWWRTWPTSPCRCTTGAEVTEATAETTNHVDASSFEKENLSIFIFSCHKTRKRDGENSLQISWALVLTNLFDRKHLSHLSRNSRHSSSNV